MGTQVADYTFTIIEDGQVPLAGNFDTFSFAPVIFTVVLGLVVIAVLAYSLWLETHSSRLRMLGNDENAIFTRYFFHPIKLLRDERDLEYSLVSVPTNE